MAYVAEIVFHSLPLALLLFLGSLLFSLFNTIPPFWMVIVLISLLEPAFQISKGFSAEPLALLDGYVALQVFAINVTQLLIFKRNDFVAMASFRLIYYLYWPILWGYWRLQWLF